MSSGNHSYYDDFQVVGRQFSSQAECNQLYQQGYRLIGDINKDCVVDVEDFLLLAQAWLECYDPQNVDCYPYLQNLEPVSMFPEP